MSDYSKINPTFRWLISVSLIVFYSACSPQNETAVTGGGATDTSGPPAEKPEAIASEVLSFEYGRNEIAAAKQYKGRVIEVTGEVEDFGHGIGDRPYIALVGVEGSPGIACYLTDRAAEKAASLSKREHVTLIGRVVEDTDFDVILGGCEISE